MRPLLTTFLLSLLTPGLGYVQAGNRNSFYKTLLLFFAVLILGIALRGVASFAGLMSVLVALMAIYLFSMIHSVFIPRNTFLKMPVWLKLFFTLSFLLVMGTTLANRRSVMGIDIMRMAVPVMQPTLLPGERFIVDTWAYRSRLPKRGDVVAHTFIGQQGVYVNRIVAVGGDTIAIKNGRVYINNQLLPEPYVWPAHVTQPESISMQPVVVPRAHYFVMGDNRDASFGDSRFSGTVPLPAIIGQLTDILTSTDKARVGSRVH